MAILIRLNHRLTEDQKEGLLLKRKVSSKSNNILSEKKSLKARSHSSKVNFSELKDLAEKEVSANPGEEDGPSQRGTHEGNDNQNSKPKEWKNKNDDEDSEVLPMFGAMFIASCLGGPVCVLAGLKLGMFAAVGGGIMGYTTGKMFAESGFEPIFL